MRRLVTGWVLLLLVGTSAPARAQSGSFTSTAAVAAGAGNTWDDEGVIGSGGLVGIRADRRLFGNTFAEVSFDALEHHRSDRFVADGRTLLVTGAIVQRFGHGSAQPYVLGGIALAHHSGRAGFPEQQLINDTRSTGFALLYGGGAAFALGERFEAGPEGRVLLISSGTESGPALAYWIGVRFGMRF